MTRLFLANSVLLGISLAMDAFSVSIVNAIIEPAMKRSRRCVIAGVYAFFQFIMPLAGWFIVHSFVTRFRRFEPLIPWIALILLAVIGGSMIRDGLHPCDEENGCRTAPLSWGLLLMQGLATSIDALSVGCTIATSTFLEALTASLIIAVVTFAICLLGLRIGRIAGNRLSGRACLFGGIILVLIGIEIFVRGVFF